MKYQKDTEIGAKSYLTEFLEAHHRFNLYGDASCTNLIGEGYSLEEFPFEVNKCWDISWTEDGDYVSFSYGGEATGDPPGTPILRYSVAI